MNIQSPAEDKIIVDLTKQDMLELEITYEEMDYSTIETRRVIWTLLDEAGKALGREFDPSRRMIIEAMPKNEGGCVLSF
ncbi:MAG: adaptor protein MecA, partial [Clostridia bacterium]|nr:adaptor protein MecA [Clostridia bacterium]